MPEIPQNLQEEIKHIEERLAQKRAELQKQQKEGNIEKIPHNKELLREVVHEKLNIGPQEKRETQQGQAAEQTSPTSQYNYTPSYNSPELKDKVQELVNIAFSKSLASATQEAQNTKNPALIDAFHDALVDELYSHLVERGILKPV